MALTPYEDRLGLKTSGGLAAAGYEHQPNAILRVGFAGNALTIF